MQTRFTAQPARAPHRRGQRADLAQVRALRFLHRDLPDLRAARRRARQPARPHLSDQGHARERSASDARCRAARRPLLELPLVHDDVPVGRPLPASDRPRARARRANVPAPVRGAMVARGARRCVAVSRARARGVGGRGSRCGRSRASLPAPLRALLELAPRARGRARGARAATVRVPRTRRRGTAQARRAADGLRPNRDRARDQCGHDSLAAALRRRGRRHRRLLRRARASLGQRAARERARRRASRAAACRARRAGARCDRGQRVGLRHARQGLRLRVSRRRAARGAARPP